MIFLAEKFIRAKISCLPKNISVSYGHAYIFPTCPTPFQVIFYYSVTYSNSNKFCMDVDVALQDQTYGTFSFEGFIAHIYLIEPNL